MRWNPRFERRVFQGASYPCPGSGTLQTHVSHSGAMAGCTSCTRPLQPAVHTVLQLTLVLLPPPAHPFSFQTGPFFIDPVHRRWSKGRWGISCDPMRWQDAVETFLPLPVALEKEIKNIKWQLWETVLVFALVFVFYSRWLPCQAPIVHIPPPSCETLVSVACWPNPWAILKLYALVVS